MVSNWYRVQVGLSWSQGDFRNECLDFGGRRFVELVFSLLFPRRSFSCGSVSPRQHSRI